VQEGRILAGWVGLVALAIGGLLYYREPIFNWTVKGFLIAGILLVAAWISLAGAVAGEGLRKRQWGRDVNGAAFVLAVVFIFGTFTGWVMWGAGTEGAVQLRPRVEDLNNQLTEQKKKVIDCEGKLVVVEGRMAEIQRAMQRSTGGAAQ